MTRSSRHVEPQGTLHGALVAAVAYGSGAVVAAMLAGA
jgi:hypothetical protein